MEGRDIGSVVFPDAAAEGVPDRQPRGPGRPAGQGGHRPRLRDRRRRHRPARRARPGRTDSPLTEAAGVRRDRHHRPHDRRDRRRGAHPPALPRHGRERRSRDGARAPSRPRRPHVAGAAEPHDAHQLRHRAGGSSGPWPSCSAGSASSAPRSCRRRGVRAGAGAPLEHRLRPHRAARPGGRCATWARTRSGSPAPLGRFVSMLGAYPVHRGAADRESLRATTAIIEGGSPVVVFPEGTRRSGPVVEDLFDGPAYLAARTGVPIVPLGIGGQRAHDAEGRQVPARRRSSCCIVGDSDPAAGDDRGRAGVAERRAGAHRAAAGRGAGASSTRRRPTAGLAQPAESSERPTSRSGPRSWRGPPAPSSRCRSARARGRSSPYAYRVHTVCWPAPLVRPPASRTREGP